MSAVVLQLLRAVDLRKRLDTARARCGLWGGVLIDTEGDDGEPMIVVTRWHLTRSFHGRDAMDQVEAWLDHVGARG